MPDPSVAGEPDLDPVPPADWPQRLAVLAAAPPVSRARLLSGVAVAVIVGVVAVLAVRAPTPPPPELAMPLAGSEPAAAATTTTTAAPDVVVHAAGAVVAPGVYQLEPTARVADLLERAGGPAPGARLERLNLAAPLVDGQRVYVPVEGEVVPPVEGGAATGAAGTAAGADGEGPPPLVDLNTADAAELETLPGVGPATAAAILDERERRGRFASVDELLEVRGIGDAKLAALRDLATVS